MLDQRRDDPVTVSLDVVWQGSAGKQDARMSEISMQGCYIDTKVQGRTIGETVGFKVHLPGGPKPFTPPQVKMLLRMLVRPSGT